MKRLKLGLQDLLHALHQFQVGRNLGVLEVKQRYQRSVLGPWWVSISMLVFIIVLGTVFSRLFSVNFAEYIPYFSAGYLLWLYISTCINESTELFKQNSGFIKQIKLPYTTYILKFFTKNVVIFLHNFIVYLLILLYFQIPLQWTTLLALPAFFLVTLNLYWICLAVSLLSTRFRDMVPIINSCVQVLFFITPISWDRHLLGPHSKIVQFNPVAHFIDIVRDPLLGKAPSFNSWLIVSILATLGLAASFFFFSRVRSRIPFWVD